MTQTTLSAADAVLLMLQRCGSIDDAARDRLSEAVLSGQITDELEQELGALFEREAEIRATEIAANEQTIASLTEIGAQAARERDEQLPSRRSAHMERMESAVTEFQNAAVRTESTLASNIETAARSGEQSEMDQLRSMLQQKKD